MRAQRTDEGTHVPPPMGGIPPPGSGELAKSNGASPTPHTDVPLREAGLKADTVISDVSIVIEAITA